MKKHIFKDNVIPAISKWRKKELKFALVTLIRVDGSSPRPLGSQMTVCETGATVGQISGGCCENAIAAEAIDAIERQQSKQIKFGKDSPFIDIELPCGSSIEVQIDVGIADETISSMAELFRSRRYFRLALPLSGGEDMVVQSIEEADPDFQPPYSQDGKTFFKYFVPPLRLILVGEGPLPDMLSKQAALLEMDCFVFSRSITEQTEENASFKVFDPQLIENQLPALLDQRSAVVTLYHDHSREDQCLELALRSQAFFIGALGSRKTHEQRLLRLQAKGFEMSELQRIKGPVGIDIRSKNPAAITISIVAQILLEASQR